MMKTCEREAKKEIKNVGWSMKFYRELGKRLAPLLMDSINAAMSDKEWGKGRQMGGSWGGNGTTSYRVTPNGLELIWSGETILYIEYGTGEVGAEKPYMGEEMIDGYSPRPHTWVFRNIVTNGWEPIAPFYLFQIKLNAGQILSHEELDAIFKKAIQGMPNEIFKRMSVQQTEDFTFTVTIQVS
jgi:hypothetical protein